ETCRISVSDSGAGMSEETKSKMFDPFYTTRKSGSGLGLAVSHRIVERHNGYFEIKSAVNAGTTITIVLPPQGERR
ncbi:MAG: hybrid sensor histidine kinase/response regulator, partial [Desulfobulbaceae bacterium]|nr:hybrid sensor histidine kinase/response regulator [Desulfobulbaceae bacterium]